MENNVKFIKAAYSKTMIQIVVEGKEKWCNADKKVYNWVKHKEKDGEYKEGDIVTIEYEEKGQIWYITKLWKGQKPVDDGAQSYQTQTPAPTQYNTSSPVCSKCGASTTYMSGVSKAGKPYAGNKCSNGSCKNVDWVKAGSKPPVQQTPAAQTPVNTPPVTNVNAGEYIADSAEIIAENINGSVAQTLIALQGHVNPDNVEELIRKLQVVYVDTAIANIKKLKGIV